jgi:hypothetical protein
LKNQLIEECGGHLRRAGVVHASEYDFEHDASYEQHDGPQHGAGAVALGLIA